MFNEKYLVFFIPLIIFALFYLLKIWNQKNMEIDILDEKDIKNQIESGLSKQDKCQINKYSRRHCNLKHQLRVLVHVSY